MSDFSETQPMTSMVVLVDPAYEEPEDNETQILERSVTLTNEQWSILALCAETYATTFRKQQSEFVTTYVTRGQLDEAVAQGAKMNAMLQKLDKLQSKLV